MVRFMEEIRANPGRSGHLLSIEAARIIYETRETFSTLFNVNDPSRIVFTFNATESINLVLKGLILPGDHIITSSMEHNSVMRPLRDLEKKGVELSVVPCSPKGEIDPRDIEKKIQSRTRIIVLNHASNATGTLFPVTSARIAGSASASPGKKKKPSTPFWRKKELRLRGFIH